ncbi:MAG: hypothetical protein IT270_05030 [Saprospiraceae bacterium]|nr:hypothetical protein [Saprospiraceae bacterium]
MTPTLRILPVALLLILATFSCKKDDDSDDGNADLCSVNDSIPDDIPGWSSKRLPANYIFGNFNPQFKFLNGSEGFAIGATLIRTTNGGSVWEEVSSFPRTSSGNMRIMDAVNTQTLFVVSDTFPHDQGPSVQILQRTTDGVNWQTVVVQDWMLSYIHFSDAQNGFAWGFGVDDLFYPYFLRTTDGGSTWTPVQDLTPTFAHSQFVLQWRNAQEGLAHNGYDVAYITNDGGQTWTDISTPAIKPQVYYRSGLSSYFGNTLNNITQYTTNSGQSWTDTDPGKLIVLTVDGQNGFGIVTQTSCPNQQNGEFALATSTDGGRTWQRTRLISNFNFGSSQEVRPGLWVTFDVTEGVFYWFEKD